MVPPTDRKAPDTNKERVNTAVSAWQETLYDLIVRTSTDLPGDVEQALRSAQATEKPGNAAAALSTMLENVDLARRHGKPICQDTGTILFWVETPPGAVTQSTFREAAEKAITQATRDGVLRQNCVDTFSGRNTGNNLGHGSPVIHWHEIDSDAISVDLILKGGGCENVGAQYALPDTSLGRVGTWMESIAASWTRRSEPRAGAALPAFSAWPSAATAPRAMPRARKCSAAGSANATQSRNWPILNSVSLETPTRWA